MPGYNYMDKVRTRSVFMGRISRIFIRSVKKNWKYMRTYKKPLVINHDNRYNLYQVIIELPASKPVNYIIYVSAQESRPLSPSQALPKVKKIRRLQQRYSAPMDTAKYIICPRGYTTGAAYLLKRNGVITARTIDEVLENMKKYFRKRYIKLIDSVRGKRIYGELALLAYLLQQIVKELGETIPEDPLEQWVEYYGPLYIAEQGIEIPAYN